MIGYLFFAAGLSILGGGDFSPVGFAAHVIPHAQEPEAGQDDSSIQFPELAKELIARGNADQAIRAKLVNLMRPGKQPLSATDLRALQEISDQMQQIDQDNRSWLAGVIKKHGWPGKSLVGAEASKMAWLLVQHADHDLEFQRQCLQLISNLPAAEVQSDQLAMLTDRILVAEGRTQIYGSQCRMVGNRFLPHPTKDPHQLDQRRSKVGLPPMEQYLAFLEKNFADPTPAATAVEWDNTPPQGAGHSIVQPGDSTTPEIVGQLNPIEAQSLDGTLLRQFDFPPEVRQQLESEWLAAQQRTLENPADPDHLIWLGRRLAYLSRFRDAIEVFSKGVQQFPADARFLRHRGHRWITVREFDLAIADLQAAADLIQGQPDQVEPDGQPNAAGIPTSTLHTNIWYHLGLAYFLKHDFVNAERAFRNCLELANNNDMRVATLDWLYMTLCRLNRQQEGQSLIQQVSVQMEILENHSYHRRLLMYQGVLQPEDLLGDWSKIDLADKQTAVELATNGFGVGNWYLIQGETEKGLALLKKVTETANWGAFGFIAAEVELNPPDAKQN